MIGSYLKILQEINYIPKIKIIDKILSYKKKEMGYSNRLPYVKIGNGRKRGKTDAN